MAGTLPLARSYQNILGDMVSTFLSRFGGATMKVGGPLLSMLESTAQSDVRGTQDIFNLLDSLDVDRAEGIALDRLAADEDLTRFPLTPSSGAVDVMDTSFNKVSTKIYPGAAAPNAGTMVLKVADASQMPASGGKLYIGRDTTNFEGPISYGSTAQVGTYWTVTLSTPTQKFHDVNEAVTLAQGGNRTVAAGSVVQTPQGNVSDAVTFTTLTSAVIPDGETEVDGISIICQQYGVIGNVAATAISQFQSKPFPGASVVNSLPYSNGLPAETDAQLRERIKAARQSRSRGTPLALITNSKGVQAPDEHKTVISASVVQIQGEPATLFIDDGSGYEEANEGVASEALYDAALGGEKYFSLAGAMPVAKAFAITNLAAPFALVSGAKLSVDVAGVLTEHTFSDSEFRSIQNATAFEVVTAINGDPALLFNARTANNGTQVVLFARSDINEDIGVTAPAAGIDANTFLGFPRGINYTLRLYKNDKLLYKDGKSAIVTTPPQTSWASTIATGVYIKVQVDGTPAFVYKIVDQDFVNANTGYTSVAATNSLASWASVFNARIPGINCTVNGDALQFISNRNANDLAALSFSAPISSDIDTSGASVGANASKNLVAYGMFSASSGLTAQGRSNDYTLNRNTGEGKLSVGLSATDRLTAGTIYTRAYVQSQAFSAGTVTVGGNGGRIWLVADGAAQIIPTGINSGITFNISQPSTNLVKYLASSAVFQNVKYGDWMIVWDSNFIANGAWRVAAVDAGFTWVEVERALFSTQTGVAPLSNGIVFVRSSTPVQTLHIPAGSNTPLTALASSINSSGIKGVTASVFRNKYLRLTTQTFSAKGDIFVATADANAQALKLPLGQLATNTSSHLAAIESGNAEAGTPSFGTGTITSYAGTNGFQVSGLSPTADKLLSWDRRLTNNYGVNVGKTLPIYSIVSSTITPHTPYPVLGINVGGLVRSASITTATTTTAHGYQIGDLVFIGAVGTSDANYAPGYYAVRSVPTSTSFTYQDIGGSAVASTTAYATTYDVGVLTGDRLWYASPYSIGPGDNLTLILDSNATNKNYNIPMFRNIKPAGGATYGSTISVLDADNANADLSAAFGSSFDFSDYALYARARGKSHASSGDSAPTNYHYNKALLWRYTRMGSEGNQVRIQYINPSAPSQSMALQTRNGQYADIKVQMPSGTARTGLSLYATTKFTASKSTAGARDLVTLSYSKPSVTLNRAGSTVTATTGSVHGFAVGDVVYLTGVDVNFPTGAKTVVTVPTGLTFTYVESGTSGASTGSMNVSSAPADPSFAAVLVGDLVNIGGTSLPAGDIGTFRITAVTSTTFTFQTLAGTGTAFSTPTSIGPVTALAFYPITATAASAFAAWVNTNQSALVTAVAVENGGGSPGAGLIDTSTLDEYLLNYGNSTGGTPVLAWPLFDGVNYVQQSTVSSSPAVLTLKNSVASDLTTNNDFSDETFRLVPVTASKVAAYLSNSAISGFYAGSEVDASSNGGRVQLSSLTIGSSGSIQVTGGSANSVGALISGAGTVVDTNYARVTIPASQTKGLVGGQWVAVQASSPQIKPVPLISTTTMAIAPALTSGQWTVTFSVQVSTIIQTMNDAADAWQIDVEGRFVHYHLVDGGSLNPISGSVTEGSWVKVKLAGANPLNLGTFQVVRTTTGGFWVENPNGVPDYSLVVGGDSVTFLTYDSVIEGDSLVIDTPDFGAQNRGSFTVVDATTSTSAVTVVGTMQALGTTPIGATDLPFMRFIEGSPIRLIKRVWTIGQNASGPAFMDVVFDTTALATKMSSGAGCSILPLDKLAFSTDLTSGADAYSSAVGLIGEVNKVIYGDAANPSSYPGVVAAGAQVNISGPLVRRVQIGLEIRVSKGATAKDVEARVKSAVAAVINQVPLGTAVDIGSIVAAARGVPGVASVAVTAPTYGSGNDLIAIQAGEKARILNIDQDVLVSIVGQ